MVKVTQQQPNCPNGHGHLVKVPHLWSLTGYNEQDPQPYFPQPNGSKFLIHVWVCTTCGLCQLYDPDVAR